MAIKFHCYPGLVSFVKGVLTRINSGLQDAEPVRCVLYLSDVNRSDVVTLEIVVALKLLPIQELFKCMDTRARNEVGKNVPYFINPRCACARGLR